MDYMVHMEGMNNKVFSNIDIDPRDTIALAETESTLWYEDMIKWLRIQLGIDIYQQNQIHRDEGGGVSQMDLERKRTIFQYKDGITLYKVLMD